MRSNKTKPIFWSKLCQKKRTEPNRAEVELIKNQTEPNREI
jgi:hypothetical protein